MVHLMSRITTTFDFQLTNGLDKTGDRAAGRAGFTVESKIAAFYGPGNTYWTRTLACANASAEGEAESSSNTSR